MPRSLAIAMQIAGRPWTVWVFGFAMIALARASGAGGFDAVVAAIGPTVLWFGFSFVCRVLAQKMGDPFQRSILPADKPLPAAQIAVVVVPDVSTESDLDAACMVAKLPKNLRSIIR